MRPSKIMGLLVLLLVLKSRSSAGRRNTFKGPKFWSMLCLLNSHKSTPHHLHSTKQAMEFQDVGAHCSVESCNLRDFLPFHCGTYSS